MLFQSRIQSLHQSRLENANQSSLLPTSLMLPRQHQKLKVNQTLLEVKKKMLKKQEHTPSKSSGNSHLVSPSEYV